MDYRAVAGPSSKAQSEQRTIVWVDESAFYPLPAVVRTYAPRGETPILRSLVTHDHLSVISGLTMDGQLLMQIQEQAFRGPAVVGFLRHLLRHRPGNLLVIWDGAPIHRAQPVKDFLAQGAAARLQLEQLPGYAPELNPDEGIWRYLKHVELGNLCCEDLAELRLELRLATKRLRHKRTVLQGCIAQCGYAA
jgi:transposase